MADPKTVLLLPPPGAPRARTIPALAGVTDPVVALAHVLAARAGCEVVILEAPDAP